MSAKRSYVSPRREAQAAATRQAVLEAFCDQLTEPGRDSLSPTEAAEAAGCSVRTVHGYFPTRQSRVEALAEHLESQLYPDPVDPPATLDDLPGHYRRIHAAALATPLAAALLAQQGSEWREVRQRRRAERLASVRDVVASSGAPKRARENALAMLLALAGGEVSIAMREQSGLSDERVLDSLEHTVELIVADLAR